MSPKPRPGAKAKGVLEVDSRAERQKQRNLLGTLVSLQVTDRTRRRNLQAYARFAEFVWCMCLLLSSFEALDEAASAYVEELWQSGDPKLWAADSLASIHHYVPLAKRRLPLAWSLLKAWSKHELPARACPVDVPLLMALCGAFLRAHSTRAALMCVVAYHLLLRTGEMFGVRAGDLTFDSAGAAGIVALGQTKTSQRQGVNSAVTVEDTAVAWILSSLASDLRPGDRLLSCAQGAWRKQLIQLVAALDLTFLHIRGYSLRRGGATTHFRIHNSFDSTVERGRWASLSTARQYLEDAAAQTATLAVPEGQRAQLSILGQEFREYVVQLIGEKAVTDSPLFSAGAWAKAQKAPSKPTSAPPLSLPTPKRQRTATKAPQEGARGLQRSVNRLLRK